MATSAKKQNKKEKLQATDVERKEYTIDAHGKRIGRIATEAAAILLGKRSASFARNAVAPVSVTIINARGLDMSEKRGTDTFWSHSGYPGGRKTETMSHFAKRRGYAEMLRKVVSGMIPKNRLHKLRMKNLTVAE